MQKHSKKRVLALIAAGLAAAILLGGTWAAKLDQATGRSTGGSSMALANLVENFEAFDGWRVGDAAKIQEIRVENLGGTGQYDGYEYTDVYTRISLKEYLEITPIRIEYFIEAGQTSPSLFLIDPSDGLFVRFDGALAPPSPDCVKASGIDDDGIEYWYVRAKAGDSNGQYGRMLPVGKAPDPDAPVFCPDGHAIVDHTLLNAQSYGHEAAARIECGFTVHNWAAGKASGAFRHYVSWSLGDAVINYSDWLALGGESVAAWILDDTDFACAYAYWGAPVAPGASTGNLLEKVMLAAQPEGDFVYMVHADMQAVDLAGLSSWEGSAPAAILGALRGTSSVVTPPEPAAIELNAPYDDAPAWKPSRSDSKDRIYFDYDKPGHENEVFLMPQSFMEGIDALGCIEIPLSVLIKAPQDDGSTIDLDDVRVTNIESPAGYAFTAEDICVEDQKLISKCLLRYEDIVLANFDGEKWTIEIPVTVTLTETGTGKSVNFTVVNMYQD